jgi:hypothetical protein
MDRRKFRKMVRIVAVEIEEAAERRDAEGPDNSFLSNSLHL